MTQRRRPSPRVPGSQHGFTLIELLVVIVILGILSAVVVFAVRGTGQKGRAAAVATDKRILRTALETYCAQKGRYPDKPDPMKQLVDEKFLSSPSEYHRLYTTPAPEATEGKCGATRYKLEEINPQAGPGPGLPPDNCPDTPNSWCVIDQPSTPVGLQYGGAPVRLFNGKYLAGSGPTGHQVYDPLGGAGNPAGTGKWTPTRAITPNSPRNMIGLDGGRCGSNCHKVLVNVDSFDKLEAWKLYDPEAAEPNDWTQANLLFARAYYNVPMAIIKGTQAQCGLQCGKVLVVGGEYEKVGPTPRVAELYDPETNSSTLSGSYPDGLEIASLTALGDGTVLMIAYDFSVAAGYTKAFLFNPTIGTGTFVEQVARPLFRHATGDTQAALLPGGRVLVTANNSEGNKTGRGRAEIYDPAAANPWSEVLSCGSDAGQDCRIVATLPNGKILANLSTFNPNLSPPRQEGSVRMFVFEPATSPPRWAEVASVNNLSTVEAGARESGGVVVTGNQAECGGLCGKVLLASSTAELYTPPQ